MLQDLGWPQRILPIITIIKVNTHQESKEADNKIKNGVGFRPMKWQGATHKQSPQEKKKSLFVSSFIFLAENLLYAYTHIQPNRHGFRQLSIQT